MLWGRVVAAVLVLALLSAALVVYFVRSVRERFLIWFTRPKLLVNQQLLLRSDQLVDRATGIKFRCVVSSGTHRSFSHPVNSHCGFLIFFSRVAPVT